MAEQETRAIKIILARTGLVLLLSVLLWAASTGSGVLAESWSVSGPDVRPNEVETGPRQPIVTWAQLPLYFVENDGQVDPAVAYYIQGHDKTLYFTVQGVTSVLQGRDEEWAVQQAIQRGVASRSAPRHGDGWRFWTLSLTFVGANRSAWPVGQQQARATISYFRGPREQWRAGLRTFTTLVYADLWPGIDLIYWGTGDRLKYQFVVHPGADPAQIRLAYAGATLVAVNPEGQLDVSTPVGAFLDDRPYAYQHTDAGQQVAVDVSYALSRPDTEGVYDYGFQLGPYDRSQELIIDPSTLLYCGYIGGLGQDEGRGIAVDSAGNAYVVGTTTSSELTFPEAIGPYLTHSGGFDVFVAKVGALDTSLIYCGYIGGSGTDRGTDIVVDADGNAYITGRTDTGDGTFPVVVGPDLEYNDTGFGDAFVAKINPAGTDLVFCGYIGGDHDDEGFGVDLDGSRNVYVVGSTYSTQATFPVSVGPDVSHNGSSDAFVAKVKADGTELLYCGYIGGSGYDSGLNVAVDGSGNAYVCGHTLSDESAFPLMTGPGLTYGGGSQRGDGFVAKVRADGTGLTYCGYIGGDQDDSVEGVAIDSLGSAFVTGWTSSSEATFPITNTTWPSSTVYNGGASDAFVAKVHPSGAVLSYCGYLGGSGEEQAHDIALDALGHAYVTGFTGSDERTFPVVVGPDLTHNGGYDCFVAKVDPIASGLVFCGYFGGTGNDEGWAIVADQLENTYVTGQTSSTEGSFPVFRGPDLVYNGGLHDAFVAKVSAYLDCSMSVSAPPGGVCAGSSGHTASVPDSGPGALFGWSIENGIITSVPTYTETISWTAGAVGMVGIGITITDTQGYTCSATVAVVAYENPDCTITTDAPEVCAGSAGHTAWVPSAGGGASYDWALSGGSITAGQNSNVITWTAGAPGTITITLALTDPWGCGCTNSVTVTGKAAPAAGFSAYPQSCCAPLTVQFTDTSTSENGGLAGGGGSLATGVLPQGRIPATCTQAVASTPCPYGSLIPWVVAAS